MPEGTHNYTQQRKNHGHFAPQSILTALRPITCHPCHPPRLKMCRPVAVPTSRLSSRRPDAGVTLSRFLVPFPAQRSGRRLRPCCRLSAAGCRCSPPEVTRGQGSPLAAAAEVRPAAAFPAAAAAAASTSAFSRRSWAC